MPNKSKELTKITDKEIQKELIVFNNIKEEVLNTVYYTHDLNVPFKELCKKFTKAITEKNESEMVKLNKELQDMSGEIKRMYSLESKYYMTLSVDDRDIGAAMNMACELEKEYGVKTASERSLVQTAVVAYFRMHKSNRMYYAAAIPDWLSHERAHFVSIYSKDNDRAYKQYLNALQTLKQLKTPPMNVNIKTNTAFVAQNQQNVANPETNDQQ